MQGKKDDECMDDFPLAFKDNKDVALTWANQMNDKNTISKRLEDNVILANV